MGHRGHVGHIGFALRRRLSFVIAQVLGLIVLADWLFRPRDSSHGPQVEFDGYMTVPITVVNEYPGLAPAVWPGFLPPLGVNVAIFCTALLTAILCRGGVAWRTWPGRLLLVGLAGLVFALLRDPSPLAIAMSIVGLAALAIVDRQGWSASAAMGAIGLASFGVDALKRPFRDASAALRWRRTRREHAGAAWSAGAIALRWLLPIGLAAIFIGLFAIANPVIAHWFANVPALPSPLRVLLWLVVGLAAWGLLRGRGGATARGGVSPSTVPSAVERFAGWDWITRSLIAFNAIFAVQTSLDLLYLLGRAELPDGMTYAQYAHRGAYPLIVAALLAGWFVLMTFRPGGLAERHTTTRRLVQLWIAQTLLLAISAMWRLSMYVEVYSLTRLRVAAAIWMVLVAIGLALLIARIARGRSDRWLLNSTTLATACVLYACSFIDFNRVIADHNVTHCRELARSTDPALETRRAPLDIAYLERLGPPALPALQRFADADHVGDHAGDHVGDHVGDQHASQRTTARDAIRRLELDLDRELYDWRGWTLARAALLRSRPMRAAPARASRSE